MSLLHSFRLPFPISVNHFYNTHGHYKFISEKGLIYNKQVLTIIKELKITTIDRPIKMEIYVVEPNRLRRDLDNLLKCTLDSLVKASFIKDDHLIHDLRIYKKSEYDPEKKGYIRVEVFQHP